jgi:hypothetical protein
VDQKAKEKKKKKKLDSTKKNVLAFVKAFGDFIWKFLNDFGCAKCTERLFDDTRAFQIFFCFVTREPLNLTFPKSNRYFHIYYKS